MKNQVYNTCNNEFSEDEHKTWQGDVEFLSKMLSETSPVPQPIGPSKLDSLLEQIKDCYIQRFASQAPILNHSSQSPILNHSSQAAEHDFLTPFRQLFLEKQDWKLWQVKYTPRKEYFIIHDLMQQHEMLLDELHSAFYNSWDVRFLYLGAKFTKLGISSLQEVLCKYFNLRWSSIAVIPKADLQRCLTLAYDSQPAQ
ncbi:hypothetical protein BT96DRAFT_946809 [Gymnopus androsaceus JB14]|uniref:Uncharacterized protein n=1 Tax=Gymnopus androsaceus JB14 TaxID=1447944 RepID=A0A6A4GWS7_9AGAR|nr:hypothetical protein BT96DRAFT_946809 [Gymnopus androsaceus JB14]